MMEGSYVRKGEVRRGAFFGGQEEILVNSGNKIFGLRGGKLLT